MIDEVEQLKKFLTNKLLKRPAAGRAALGWEQRRRLKCINFYLGVSEQKTLHNFYLVDCDHGRRKWQEHFTVLLELNDIPDNIRESTNNILIMGSRDFDARVRYPNSEGK